MSQFLKMQTGTSSGSFSEKANGQIERKLQKCLFGAQK